MALNVTTAVIGGGCQRAVSSPSLAQWDRGQILKITGVDLPVTYNVEFCCQGDLTTTTMLGGADGVEIPNLLLQRGLPIIAYLVLHEGQDDRETEYWITIYVKQRAMPPSVTPDPEQADIIDQLVAALDEGVTAAENAAAQAEAQVEHYPTVIDGTWHVWNALTESWVDTEVPATGPAGRGITSVTQNADYTLTLTFTDGTAWTTPTPVRGATGATPNLTIGTVTTGAAGSSAAASISGTAENPVLSLTIPQGLKGDPGNGDAIAPTFSASTAYPAGTYVIYNGSLYRFTVAHAAGAWTGTDAVAAVLGTDVADLKGDLNDEKQVVYNGKFDLTNLPKGYITANTIGATVDYTRPTSEQASFRYLVITNVPKGKQFRITSTGGNAAKPWSWLTSAGVVLSFSSANTVTDEVITSPADGSVLVTNYNYTATMKLTQVLSFESINDLLDDRTGAIPEFSSTDKVSLSSGDVNWIQGALSASDGLLSHSSATRISTGFIPLRQSPNVFVSAGSAFQHRCLFYNEQGEFIYTQEQYSWSTSDKTYTSPSGATLFRICVAYINGANITPSVDTQTAYTIKSTYRADNNWNLKGKVLSILGDSLTTFGGSVDDDNDNRYSPEGNPYTYPGNKCRYPQLNLLTQVGETYWMKLIQYFGFTLGINESWAGSCVTWDGTSISGGYAKENCLSSQTRIDHLNDNGEPDIILINAGTNDIGQDMPIGTFNTENPMNYTDQQIADLDVTTFADAYRAMLIRLQKKYPNSVVIAVLPNYASSYYTPSEADAYNEIIKEACDYFGVLWVDARTSGVTMFNRAKYLPDGLHYNAAGMELIYTNVKNAIDRNYK